MIASRRSFIRNLFVAPAIVAATNIMPIKAIADILAPINPNTLGYKAGSTFDAGVFYCPYVPLQHVRAGPAGANTTVEYDPAVYISLIRREMPNLIAYDIIGAQPMTGPTGLIFALRSRYANT